MDGFGWKLGLEVGLSPGDFVLDGDPFTFAMCYRPSACRLSVVCNVRAPYSGGSNFRQYFYGIWYPSHPLTSTENFTEIVPGEPLRRGELNTRGVVQYSDFGPIDGYISETVQDRRQVSINHL